MAIDRTATPGRLAAIALLIGVLGGWPILGAASLGSLDIPHNDGWAYGEIAATFAATGEWHLVGFNRPALIGQAAAAWPFHLLPLEPAVANHLAVATWGVLLLGLVAAAAWRLCGYRRALLATIVIGIWPGFALLSVSFMTDVPSAAVGLLSLLLGIEAVRGRGPALIAAVAVGFYGTTIRDQMLVVPAAVLLTAWVYLPARRRLVGGLGVLLLAATAAFELWRRSLPFDDPPRTWLRTSMIDDTISGTGVLALALLPIVILALARRGASGVRDRWFIGTAAAWTVAWAAMAVAAWTGHRPFGLPGNYVDRVGAYVGDGVGGRPAILPGAVWWGVVALAALASIALAGEVAVRLHRLVAHRSAIGEAPSLTVVALVGLGLVAAIVLPALIGQRPFDRYWMAVAVPIALLLLAPALDGPRRIVSLPVAGLAVGAVAGLAAFSVVLAGNAWAHDSARWRLAEEATARGFAAYEVDAGLEWVGSSAQEPAQHFREPTAGQFSWPTGMFPGSVSCVVVTADPAMALPWGEPLVRTTVRRLGWFGPEDAVGAYVTRLCGVRQ